MDLLVQLRSIKERMDQEYNSFKLELPNLLNSYLKTHIVEKFIQGLPCHILFTDIIAYLYTHNFNNTFLNSYKDFNKTRDLKVRQIQLDRDYIQLMIKKVLHSEEFKQLKPHIHFKQQRVKEMLWFNSYTIITSDIDYITFEIPKSIM